MNKKIKLWSIIIILGLAVFCGGKAISNQQNVTAADPSTTQSGETSRVIKVDQFNSIKFAAYRPDIKISSGNNFQVTVSGNQGADINKIKAEVKNKQLVISDQPEKSYRDGNYYINITVPNTTAIKKLTGSCDSGDFSLNQLNIPQVNMSLHVGDVKINHLKTKNIRLKLKNGDLKISNSNFNKASFALDEGDFSISKSNFKANVTMGEMGYAKVKSSKLLGNSSFKLAEGNFQMSNAPKLSYKLATKHSGIVKVHNKSHHHNFSKTLSHRPLLKVTSKSGDINIK